MASIVDDEKKEVAFLYRLTTGPCPRSYGMHVASMAGKEDIKSEYLRGNAIYLFFPSHS